MGTPSYMAPEQAGGKTKEMGPACDVYALGAILYECLTGRPPFKAATALDTLVQVLADEPVPPRQLQSKTPRDLETICLKCLEKQPAPAVRDGGGAGGRPGALAAGEPVRRGRRRWGTCWGNRSRRYRTPLTVAAGMLLAVGGGRDGGVRAAAGRGHGAEELRDGGQEWQGLGEGLKEKQERSTA